MKREEVEATFEGRDLGPIEEHLEALATEDALPTLALGMCLMRMEEAAPALRAVLEKGATGTALSDEESLLLFRGVHILGGARDTESFPTMLRLLRRPGQELDDQFGDAIAENFARIIAGLFDGNVDALFAAVGDRSLDETVRSELLGAATFLTWNGTIPRERIRRLLEGFFERELESGDVAPDGWLRSIALLGFRDMAAPITRAWQEGRIGDWMVDPDQFERLLSQAERNPDDAARFEDCGLGYVEDVLTALETVDYMRSDEFREAMDDDFALDDDAFGDDIARSTPSEPVRNPWRNVGRNDPCPCGSGKKAKKCCLANNS